ncbi:MAG: hypothetical protein M3O29_00620 [Actinomycetota bacterium]|nr:hypothetical protein [Actinomycetota bacterium]
MTHHQSSKEYQFNKDLAAHIVYAEVRHFVDEEPQNRTEEEVQTLTRTIQYKIDQDLHWVDVDELIDQIKHLRSIAAGTDDEVRLNEARTIDNRAYLIGRYFPYLRSNIDGLVRHIKPRYELAA